MPLAPLANEPGVRIIHRQRLGALAARDRAPLLGEMRAREVIGHVRRGEDKRSLVEGKRGCVVDKWTRI